MEEEQKNLYKKLYKNLFNQQKIEQTASALHALCICDDFNTMGNLGTPKNSNPGCAQIFNFDETIC